MDKTRRPATTGVEEEYPLLLKDVQFMEDIARPDGTITPAVLSERLDSLQVRLAEHFRSEEQDGFAQDVLTRAPHLERKVRNLLNEHAGLASSLAALTKLNVAGRCLDDALRDKLRTWVHCFREHESQENLLLEDSFDVECCAED